MTTLPSQGRLVIDLNLLVLNFHEDLLFFFDLKPNLALSLNAMSALLLLLLLLLKSVAFYFFDNLLSVAHLNLVVSLVVFCDVLLDSHYVLLTFRSIHLLLLMLLAMLRV